MIKNDIMGVSITDYFQLIRRVRAIQPIVQSIFTRNSFRGL
jgi:hypothetical protein